MPFCGNHCLGWSYFCVAYVTLLGADDNMAFATGGSHNPGRCLVPAYKEEGPFQETGRGAGVDVKRPLRPLQDNSAKQPGFPSDGGEGQSAVDSSLA